MMPCFAASPFVSPGEATFAVSAAGVAGTPFAMTLPVGPSLFNVGASTVSGSLWGAFITALNALSAGTFSMSPSTPGEAYGVRQRLAYMGSATGNVTITPTNQEAKDTLAALGFGDGESPVVISALFGQGSVQTTTQPTCMWFPFAHIASEADFRTVRRQVSTSGLAGAGHMVSSVQQDDGVTRQWRVWDLVGVSGPRMNVMRARITQWAARAGITGDPERYALDGARSWWTRVVSGKALFAAVEDITAQGSDIRWSTYRIVYDGDAPVTMSGFSALNEPVVVDYAPAMGRKRMMFCALHCGGGNFPPVYTP